MLPLLGNQNKDSEVKLCGCASYLAHLKTIPLGHSLNQVNTYVYLSFPLPRLLS